MKANGTTVRQFGELNRSNTQIRATEVASTHAAELPAYGR